MNIEDLKEKIIQMLAEANDNYNISGMSKETYRKLETRIKALEDVLDLFE